MPQLIPMMSGVAFWSFVAEVALMAYSLYEANRQAIKARKDARDAYNASLQDRLITVRSAVSARAYVLGTIRKSGALLYACGAES